jgi:hypothetical protein
MPRGGTISSESTMTRMQELGSAWIFKRAIKDNKRWGKWEDIRLDDKTFPELVKIWKRVGGVDWDDQLDAEWLESFWKQQSTLVTEIGRPNFTLFTRDGGGQNSEEFAWQKTGGETFMEWIEKFINKETGFEIDNKDNWNPADIWLIRNEEKHKSELEAAFKKQGPVTQGQIEANLRQFNGYMRGLFIKKQIMGISLKKVGKGAAIFKEVNVTSRFYKHQRAIEMTYIGARCSLGTKAIDRKAALKNRGKQGFATTETQEARLFVKHGSDTYEIQIKANDSRKMSNLKWEPTQTNRGAAKMGKATREWIFDLMKSYKFGQWSEKWQDYPQYRDQKQKGDVNGFSGYDMKSGYYGKQKEFYNMITELGNEVDWGGVTPEVAMVNLAETFGQRFNQPWVANAKLQEIAWLYAFLSTCKTQKQRNQFVTDIIFLAAKEGKDFNTRYGPFGKIY